MGLGRAFLDDLIELKRIGALRGARSVIEIGAQQLSDTLILVAQSRRSGATL